MGETYQRTRTRRRHARIWILKEVVAQSFYLLQNNLKTFIFFTEKVLIL
jgi:hypothetical protein